ncbi:cupin domain-containing protein [Tomitella biformata]|uniref:cupin domain-containing protein n=1 Tax=Tomitella biformata TaxID=630403 RepID=UPI0004663954|nr:cupin domain-containing protein [Tomitella biformata]
MQKMSLDALVRELRAKVAGTTRQVASQTVFGGHEKTLRQTLVVIAAGGQLAEHEGPGEATVQVLDGRISLITATDSWEGRRGDLLIVPNERHSVDALEDSAFLLTVAKPRA